MATLAPTTDQTTAVKIRKARSKDAEQLAELSGQLGYPTTAAEICTRMGKLRPIGKHAVFVAELKGGGVIGWLHVSVSNLLEADVRGEVNGLVVADGQRSAGAGAKLLRAAEDWARRQGCKAM